MHGIVAVRCRRLRIRRDPETGLRKAGFGQADHGFGNMFGWGQMIRVFAGKSSRPHVGPGWAGIDDIDPHGCVVGLLGIDLGNGIQRRLGRGVPESGGSAGGKGDRYLAAERL